MWKRISFNSSSYLNWSIILEVYHIVDVDRICNIKHQNKDISDFNIQIIMTNQQIYEWLKRIKITTKKG